MMLCLAMTPGVGWKTTYQLLQAGLDESGYQMTPKQWRSNFSMLSQKQAEALSETLNKDKVNHYLQELQRKEICFVTIEDEHYPDFLREIAQPPWVLFLRGDQDLLDTPSISVVGSRKASSYGRSVIQTLIPALVDHGFTIVSGMALGIDALAHQAALKAKGKTVAVLGCGLDIVYPRQNRSLYQHLLQDGLLISEYPPGTSPHPAYFPQRNRIIAGLSYGVLVIEAAEKSGSLITAHYALENGREVFALPGSIYQPQSAGTNRLIQRQGAKLIIDVADIMEELEPVLPEFMRHSGAELERSSEDNIIMDEKEIKLLSLIRDEKVHINDLHLNTNWSLSELSRILIKLEMNGKIMALPGSFYQRRT